MNEHEQMQANLDEHGALTPAQLASMLRWQSECAYRALGRLAAVVEASDDDQLKTDFAVLRKRVDIGFKVELGTYADDHGQWVQKADARSNRKPCKYTAEQYDAAVAKVGTKQEALARELGVSAKTLRTHGRPPT